MDRADELKLVACTLSDKLLDTFLVALGASVSRIREKRVQSYRKVRLALSWACWVWLADSDASWLLIVAANCVQQEVRVFLHGDCHDVVVGSNADISVVSFVELRERSACVQRPSIDTDTTSFVKESQDVDDVLINKKLFGLVCLINVWLSDCEEYLGVVDCSN